MEKKVSWKLKIIDYYWVLESSCKGFVTVNFDLTGWVTKNAIVPTVDDEIIKNVGST